MSNLPKPPVGSPAWLRGAGSGNAVGSATELPPVKPPVAVAPSHALISPRSSEAPQGLPIADGSSAISITAESPGSLLNARSGAEEPRVLSARLTHLMKVAYGAPSFATQSVSLLIAVYATDYYILLGARLSVLSFFTAWARSLDVITDPVMAWVSDQTKSRFGRRRPYILIGAPFYALFLTLLFSPPTNMSETGIGLWFCIFYCLFYLSDTMANIPYEALGPELSSDHDGRNSLFFTAKMFMFTGMLFGAVGPALVKFSLQGGFGTPTMLPCASLSWQDDGSARLHYLQAGAPPSTCTLAEPCINHAGNSCQRIHEAAGSVETGSRVYTFDLLEVEAVCGGNNNGTWAGAAEAVRCWKSPWDDVCIANGEGGGGGGLPCIPSTMWAMDDGASQRITFTIVAATFGAYYVFTAIGCVSLVKENARPFIHKHKAPLVGAMVRTFRNSAFRTLLLAWTLEGIGLSALVSIFPFYVRYALVSDGEKAAENSVALDPTLCMGASVAGLLITATLASPLWLFLAKRLGKYRAWMLFNFGNVVTNALFFLPREGETIKLIIVTALNGLPFGGTFLVQSVLSDIIDYDEFLYGFRNEGIFSVYAALIPKFVAIPSTAIPLALVNMLGFVQPLDGIPQPQTALVRKYIRGIFVAFPVFCYAVGFCIKAFLFPLKSKETHEAICAGVAVQRKSDAAVEDPITGQMISPMRLMEEEEDLAYHLENFGPELLTKLLTTGDTEILVQAMRRHIYIGVIASLGSCAITIITGWLYLDDPVLSIIPVTIVIFFGFFLCFLVVAVLRYRAALALRKAPRLLLSKLSLKIRDHKVSRSAPQSRNPSMAELMGASTNKLDSSVMVEPVEEDKPSGADTLFPPAELSTPVMDFMISVPNTSLP